MGADSFVLPHGLWGLNSGHQALVASALNCWAVLPALRRAVRSCMYTVTKAFQVRLERKIKYYSKAVSRVSSLVPYCKSKHSLLHTNNTDFSEVLEVIPLFSKYLGT